MIFDRFVWVAIHFWAQTHHFNLNQNKWNLVKWYSMLGRERTTSGSECYDEIQFIYRNGFILCGNSGFWFASKIANKSYQMSSHKSHRYILHYFMIADGWWRWCINCNSCSIYAETHTHAAIAFVHTKTVQLFGRWWIMLDGRTFSLCTINSFW